MTVLNAEKLPQLAEASETPVALLRDEPMVRVCGLFSIPS